tara:strand:- start:83 stop:610 length:528 start_codon:yes stop_codon:yes gene_type:complete
MEKGESEEIVVSNNVEAYSRITQGRFYSDGNKWNMPLLEQFTSLDGRINRLRYLLLSLGASVAGIVYIVIVGIIFFFLSEPFWTIALTIFALPIFYVQYAIAVKRLQDTGRGGGWITYVQIWVILCIIYSLTPLESDIELFMQMISGAVGFPLVIVCLFFRGDEGHNEFGHDPLG